MSDILCPLKARSRMLVQGQPTEVDVPCALRLGHTEPCRPRVLAVAARAPMVIAAMAALAGLAPDQVIRGRGVRES